MAWTRQVPAEVAEIVLFAVVFASEHPEAVPPDAIAYVTAPEPKPPEVLKVSACKKGALLLTLLSESIKAVCADFWVSH